MNINSHSGMLGRRPLEGVPLILVLGPRTGPRRVRKGFLPCEAGDKQHSASGA